MNFYLKNWGRLARPLVALLGIALFAAGVLGAIHHHEGHGGEHACAVCQVAGAPAAAPPSHPHLAGPAESAACFADDRAAIRGGHAITAAPSRAPPLA